MKKVLKVVGTVVGGAVAGYAGYTLIGRIKLYRKMSKFEKEREHENAMDNFEKYGDMCSRFDPDIEHSMPRGEFGSMMGECSEGGFGSAMGDIEGGFGSAMGNGKGGFHSMTGRGGIGAGTGMFGMGRNYRNPFTVMHHYPAD